MFTRWQWWSSRSRAPPPSPHLRGSPPTPRTPCSSQHRGRPLVTLVDELEEERGPVPGHRRVAALVHHQEGEVGKDPRPAQQLPPSCPPPRATRPNPSAVRKPPAGPARSFDSPGRSPGASSPPPEGPGKPPSPYAGPTPARGVSMAPQSGADRGPPPQPERGPTTLLLTLCRRTPPMAIRPKRKGRKGHPTQEPYEARESLLVLVATTLIYDAVSSDRKNHEALPRTLGYAGRYAGRNAPVNQNAPANETPDQGLGHFVSELKGDVIPEVMARVDKRREEFIAAKNRRR